MRQNNCETDAFYPERQRPDQTYETIVRTWGLNVYMVAKTALNTLKPTPRNTVRNVKTGRVGSSCVEMTYTISTMRTVRNML